MRDDRAVIITGASGGLGREIALRFGRAGCRVLVHYHRNKESAELLVRQLEECGAEGFPYQADVRSLPEMSAMILGALKRWPRLDLLIANAAIRRDSLLLRTASEEWDLVLETNLKGVWTGLKAAGEIFTQQKGGHVIAIGSVAGLWGRAGQASYAASKAGLIGLIRTVAKEWSPYQIQLNLVLPGFQKTPMTQSLATPRIQALKTQALLPVSPPIPEVADFIYRLSRTSGVTGQIFNLDSRLI